MGVTEFIIFRHGQTDWNRERRVMGKTDIPLNELGKSQAQLLAVALMSLKIDAFYSAPLKRAKETAEIVSKAHGKPVNTIDDLIEMDLGQLTGKTKDERSRLFPDFDPADDEQRSALNMDLFSDWISRLRLITIPPLLSSHNNQVVALSTHDQKMRAILVSLGMPLEVLRTPLKNTAVSIVDVGDGRIKVISHNDATHLK